MTLETTVRAKLSPLSHLRDARTISQPKAVSLPFPVRVPARCMRQAVEARLQQVRFLLEHEALPLSAGDRMPEEDLRQCGGTGNCHVCQREL